MAKKRTKASDFSEPAVVERAVSLATQWMWAVSLQHDRTTSPRPRDADFYPFGVDSFNEADVHSWRSPCAVCAPLRPLSSMLRKCGTPYNAIQEFDKRLPWLKRLRDVFEHLEDYAVDSNLRRSDTSCRELQVWSGGENGMQWLGFDVDWKEALLAAKDLYSAVRAANDFLPSRRARDDREQQDDADNNSMQRTALTAAAELRR